ncbi:MAG TPA: hypothetical protein VLZ33_08020 [Dysgonamonadaceae bacterium]|nr:hypothetical protein [Dysgonamonadaceae bacterium]
MMGGGLFLHLFHPEMHPKQLIWHYCDVALTPKVYEWYRLQVEQVPKCENSIVSRWRCVKGSCRTHRLQMEI